MKQARTLHRTLVVLTSLILISGLSLSTSVSASGSPGPVLSVPEETMAAALSCPAWDNSARINGAANIAVQDLCPGRRVEHVQVVHAAAFYAVGFDALAHDGAADAARIDRSVCMEHAMPGVDNGEAMPRTIEIDRDLMMLTGEHHAEAEPALASYARS